MEGHIAENILWIGGIILLSSIVYVVTQRFKKVPFPIVLFLIGMGASLLNLDFIPEELKLNQDNVFYFYLPLLLFESAFHFDFKEFKKIVTPGFIFASIGLLISSVLIALPLNLIFDIPLLEAFLFGSIISSTDPIAVLSIFKSLGVPKKLQLLVDGESFLNDATSVVLFRIVLGLIDIALIEGSGGTNIESTVVSGMFSFIYLLVGGVVIGTVVGWIASELISFIKNEPIIEVTITVVAALSAFIISEDITKTSGIISVLACGLIIGNYGKTKISPSASEFINQVWEQIGFITTSMIFLLIGLEIDLSILTSDLRLVGVTLVVVYLSRFIMIYGLSFIINFANKTQTIPLSWQHILSFSGLRGVLPLVLVLSLSSSVTFKDKFIPLVLTIIVVTMLINTFVVSWLIKKKNLSNLDHREEMEQKIAKLILSRKMYANLKEIANYKEINKETLEKHEKTLIEEIENHTAYLVDMCRSTDSNLSENVEPILKLYFAHAEKAVYRDLYSKQIISTDLYDRLCVSIENQICKIENNNHQFSSERIGLESKRKKLRKINFSTNSILNKVFRNKANKVIEDIYLYYKARILGDTYVLTEMNKIFTDTSIFKIEVISKIRTKYRKLLKENSKILEEITQNQPEIVSIIEEKIYRAEINDLKTQFFKEFVEEEKFSAKVLKTICS